MRLWWLDVSFGCKLIKCHNMYSRSMRRRPVRRSVYQTGNAIAYSRSMRSMRSGRRPRRVSLYGSDAVRQYAKSILNPSLTGAKIPDDFCQPSSSFQLEQEYIVTMSAVSGQYATTCVMGLELGTLPSFMEYDGYYASTTVANNLPNNLSSARSSAIGPVYLGQVGSTGSLVQTAGVNDLLTLLSLYKACRLVSAGIKVQFAGTDATNNGVISMGYVNREFFSDAEELVAVHNTNADTSTQSFVYLTAPTSTTSGATSNNYWGLFGVGSTNGTTSIASTIQQLGTAVRSLPINAYGPVKDGCIGRYFPLDSQDTNFRMLATGGQVGAGAKLYANSNWYSYGSSGRVTQAGTQDCDYGAFIVVAEGLSSASGASFVVKCTANYEGQIRDEGLNLVSSTRSPVVPGALAKANRIYGKSWQCKVGTEIDTHPVR